MTYASPNWRNSNSFIITAALHGGLGLVLLYGMNVAVTRQAPPDPIKARVIPDTSIQPTPSDEPATRDMPIDPVVPIPPITIVPDTVQRDAKPEDPVAEAGSVGLGTATEAIDSKPQPPAGPTSAATLDRRYAADFQPPYPSAAVRGGWTGSVTVHVHIGRDGRVTEASVAQSSGYLLLDEAAVRQALTRWRFIAAQKDGVAVDSERDITVRFQLSQG